MKCIHHHHVPRCAVRRPVYLSVNRSVCPGSREQVNAEGRGMDTKDRAGWMTVLIAISVIIALVFIGYLALTLIGILD